MTDKPSNRRGHREQQATSSSSSSPARMLSHAAPWPSHGAPPPLPSSSGAAHRPEEWTWHWRWHPQPHGGAPAAEAWHPSSAGAPAGELVLSAEMAQRFARTDAKRESRRRARESIVRPCPARTPLPAAPAWRCASSALTLRAAAAARPPGALERRLETQRGDGASRSARQSGSDSSRTPAQRHARGGDGAPGASRAARGAGGVSPPEGPSAPAQRNTARDYGARTATSTPTAIEPICHGICPPACARSS